MRKYFNLMLLLSFAGAILSGILLYQHYYPEMELGFLSCGRGFSNPCIAVGQSPYASIFGIPIAAFGIFYFTLITFLMLIADYAEEYYYHIFMGLIFPVVITGTVADIVLGLLMIKIGEICTLCLWTYIINILLLLLLFLYLKKISDRNKLIEIIQGFIRPENPDRRAVLALFIVFIFFLAFSIFTGSNILKAKATINKAPKNQITRLVEGFYSQEPEKISFPESGMKLGNPEAKVKIYAFTDFLCTACYKFYRLEKYILAKYKNSVEIIYYHYPLDASCNSHMDDSVYPGSCLASKSLYAAKEAGIFDEYFYAHFSGYSMYKEGYTQDNINKNVKSALEESGAGEQVRNKFDEAIKSQSALDEIKMHIEFAESIKIEATPTVYIAGRKIVGVPPKEFLDEIILNELKKK
ncbi:MAG TPA: vitamin K epoxide reductase family protein [Spirochaetota bacterium]|nr:vitamin K epoxide reductase family protein [Spirochaetota bacterium]